MEKRNFILNDDNLQNLENFSEILKKDYSTMMNEALEDYFQQAQKNLLEKNLADQNSLTNLDYNKFWDDIEI
jgi:predicted transcriptional regulator